MSDPAARTIRLRWQGRCRLCGASVPAGERARWDGVAHTITCLSCAASTLGGNHPQGGHLASGDLASGEPASRDLASGEPASRDLASGEASSANATASAGVLALPPATIGVAGASALREYERRHAARERRARERAGVLGVWLARMAGDPSSTRSWRQGGEGEAKVAKRLAKLLDGTGVHLLHDRRAPGRSKANIDHIAVGPGGVTVIDAKMLSGKVRVESRGGASRPRRRLLLVNGHDRTRLIGGVRGQAEAVLALLERHAVVCEVRCALCFARPDGLPWFQRLELEGVTIDGPRRVAKLARRPGPLGEEQVRRIVRVLASSLTAA